MTSTLRVVVIGGGMAGARLARRLTGGPPAPGALPATPGAGPGAGSFDVTLIGEEPHRPYNRVLLAEVLAGRYPPQVIELPALGDAVRGLSGVRAVRIDRAARLVHCDDGRAVPYDTLVLATGANPVLPPLRGLFPPGSGELPDGVHPFRTMDDCRALAAVAGPGVPAVVIGGGLLGVSAARALAGRGAPVVLAHQGEHLLERHLDAEGAQLLRQHLESSGIEVHTECRVRGIETGESPGAPRAGRRVRAVELADGFRLEAALVVLACGVRPRVGLARAAGLDVGAGIRVDDALRTSDPRIFAIGDCAEHNGVMYGLAGAAQEQADAVAEVLTATATRTALATPSAPDTRPAPAAPSAPATGSAPATPGDAAALPEAAPVLPEAAAVPPYTGTRALTRLTLTAPPAPPTAPSHPFDLATFGETTPLPGDDVIRLSDATRTRYRKVVVRGDRLVGGILLGDLGTVGALARTWEGDEPLPAAPLLHLLTTDGGF